jgi:hypothetical protein
MTQQGCNTAHVIANREAVKQSRNKKPNCFAPAMTVAAI